ncbi:5-(carboxyamino)imidazole ribonucleotide synthase [Cyanobium sp. Morenito 9A2]|nr:5-(carboxyamino)imidazole ribonucleotide synthase [Cyanobium sp. Morenito 9A2]
MLAEAAAQQGVELHVQTPSTDDPATGLATAVVMADLADADATRRLGAGCRAISFENEWLDLEALAPLAAEGLMFRPSLAALEPLVNKRRQRELLERLHLPSPRWWPLDQLQGRLALDPAASAGDGAPADGSTSEAAIAVNPMASLGYPLMAKAATGGYDGKGTVLIPDQPALEALLERVEPADWILEEFVDFDQEFALVACRDGSGEVGWFPLACTHQHQQVCDWVFAPAQVEHAVEALARNVAASILASLDYVGVLSIEFFYGSGGLLVNELAPRTHNSGHYTIEACAASQFDQQVRIVSGAPLASTDLLVPGALMVNLLGLGQSGGQEAERLAALSQLSGSHVHWYGKRESRPWRKLGHLTVLLESNNPPDLEQEAARRLAEIRAIWPLPSAPAP